MIEQYPPSTRHTSSLGAARSVAVPAGLVPHLAAMLVLLLGLIAATTGWFSADEVVLRQQSAQLASASGWALEPDPAAAVIDPDHRFVLLARSERIGDQIIPYSKHPLVPVIFAGAESLFGPVGRYLPGAIGALVIGLLTSWSFGWDRRTLWLPLAATPLLFHTTVLWAHGAAAALGAVAFVLLRRIASRDRPAPAAYLTLGLAVAAVAALRSEGLLLGAALTAGLVISDRGRSGGWRLSPLAAVPLLASALVYLAEPVVRSWLVGGEPTALGVPASSSSSLIASRLGVARIMFAEPSIDGSALGQLRLVGAVLLLAGGVLAAQDRARVAPGGLAPLGLAAALFYGAGVGAGPIPGILVAAPLLAVSLPGVQLRSSGDRAVAATLAVFAVAVVATSYENAGGGDWGARYLFVAVPGLLLLTWPSLAAMWNRDTTRPLVAAALAAAVSVQVGVVIDLHDRDATVAVVDALRDAAERELGEPGAVVAVSDERLARFLHDRGLRGTAFHVPQGQETEFAELLDAAPRPVDRIVWVDLSTTGATRPGTLVETHGSVEMRTLVRR